MSQGRPCLSFPLQRPGNGVGLYTIGFLFTPPGPSSGGCAAQLGSSPTAGPWPPTPQPEPAWEACCQHPALGPPAGRGEGVPASKGAGDGTGGGLLPAERSGAPVPAKALLTTLLSLGKWETNFLDTLGGAWTLGIRSSQCQPAPAPRRSMAPGGRWDGFGACVASRKVAITCSSGLCPVAPAD